MVAHWKRRKLTNILERLRMHNEGAAIGTASDVRLEIFITLRKMARAQIDSTKIPIRCVLSIKNNATQATIMTSKLLWLNSATHRPYRCVLIWRFSCEDTQIMATSIAIHVSGNCFLLVWWTTLLSSEPRQWPQFARNVWFEHLSHGTDRQHVECGHNHASINGQWHNTLFYLKQFALIAVVCMPHSQWIVMLRKRTVIVRSCINIQYIDLLQYIL